MVSVTLRNYAKMLRALEIIIRCCNNESKAIDVSIAELVSFVKVPLSIL
jgi:hypothetical protein